MGMYNACTGRENTIEPFGVGATHTVHHAELIASQMALQHRTGHGHLTEFPHEVNHLMDGIRTCIQQSLFIWPRKHRDLLHNIVSLLSAYGKDGVCTTIAKVSPHGGIQENENDRANKSAQRAAALGAVAGSGQPLGTKPFVCVYWLHTYGCVNVDTDAQATAGQVLEAARLRPDHRAAGLAAQPPNIVRPTRCRSRSAWPPLAVLSHWRV